jgi:hypothetical protein
MYLPRGAHSEGRNSSLREKASILVVLASDGYGSNNKQPCQDENANHRDDPFG